MRIAILGSVTTIIPPTGQAAIERLAYQQALGLAQKGHQILLFALKGSKVVHPNIKLIEVGEGDVRSGNNVILAIRRLAEHPESASGTDPGQARMTDLTKKYGVSYKLRLEIVNLTHVLEKLRELKDEYDVVLNNLRGEAVLLPICQELGKPFYHVLHLPIFPELGQLFKKYQTRLISISNAQRAANPDLHYAGTVYNAVDTEEFGFNPTPGEYVLYLGSIGRNKSPHEAILAAKKAGIPLKIGGRIKDSAYYEKEIAPHIDGNNVEWVGEKTASEIVKLYQGAKAFLFPTKWAEPFGLVAIEAMSCGTPVIAYPNGALPEIIQDGVNGYLVSNIDEMATKIGQIDQIKREDCRKSVEVKFSLEKMIEGYEKVLT